MAWNRPRYSANWSEIRKQVYVRDNYTCQRCGAKGRKAGGYEDIECAHIISKSKNGKDEMSNLEVACLICHVEEHPHYLNNPVKKQQYLRNKEIRKKKILNKMRSLAKMLYS